MTAAEKKDRRQARHEMMELFRKETMRGGGLYMTPRQLKQRVKMLVDRAIKGEVPMPPELLMTPEVRAEIGLANAIQLPGVAV